MHIQDKLTNNELKEIQKYPELYKDIIEQSNLQKSIINYITKLDNKINILDTSSNNDKVVEIDNKLSGNKSLSNLNINEDLLGLDNHQRFPNASDTSEDNIYIFKSHL